MKKKIAFLMASIMSLSMMPTVASHASSENRMSNGNVTVSEKTLFYEPGANPEVAGNQSKVKYVAEGGYLNIKVEDEKIIVDPESQNKPAFVLKLENAKFAFDAENDKYVTGSVLKDAEAWDKDAKVYTRTVEGNDLYTLKVDSDQRATVTIMHSLNPAAEVPGEGANLIKIPMVVRMDENLTTGTAKVKVESGNSGLSSSTNSIATINKGSTHTKVDNVRTGKSSMAIDKLIIEEKVAGTIFASADNDGFYIELPSGYSFGGTIGNEASDIKVKGAGITIAEGNPTLTFSNSKKRLNVKFEANSITASTSIPGQLEITNLSVLADNSNDTITNEDIKATIDNLGSREMVSYEEFTIAKRADYGLSFKADGSVPTILSGYYDEDDETNDKVKSVKVVIAEETAGTFIDGDLVLSVSDGAKIRAVKIEDKDNMKNLETGFKKLSDRNENGGHIEVKAGKVTLRNIGSDDKSEKAKFTISFFLSVEPGYEGDVTLDISGDAIRNKSKAEPMVIAKAITPIKSSLASVVNIMPGQTIEVPEFVLTEQMNNKGYSALEEGKTLTLKFNNSSNYLTISGTPTVKTENGLTVKNVKVTSTGNDGSHLTMTIDDASSKNKASKITISGLKIAASTSIPQGDYTLIAAGSAVAGNSTSQYVNNVNNNLINSADLFATEGLTIARLQYGGKVAMKITIGDKKVNVNGTEVEMKVAPFIDAATGTTYMQVSDIVKATGKTCTFFDNRLQNVEGVDKNLFVTFGDRTFAKDKSIVQIAGQTLPETMTNEQGMAVNMIIKEDYACLPLRYFVEKVLGQTINWNGTDNTITVE